MEADSYRFSTQNFAIGLNRRLVGDFIANRFAGEGYGCEYVTGHVNPVFEK